MSFIDETRIYIMSGKGGNGIVGFRREKFIEFGGPDGGDGGDGGSVYVEVDNNLSTLMDYRYRQKIKAKNGGDGMGSNRTGASGKDVCIMVPPGTQVLTDEGDLIADMENEEMGKVLIAEGGRGGVGNARFKSSTNRAPKKAIQGKPGEEKFVILRLKLLSDVGLVGLPNAGKSTFLSICTAAKPKIADYPFSTLKPQLGVARIADRELVIADIPGLIEGASHGLGLGIRFLKHIERCQVIIHVIDCNSDNCSADYKKIREEISSYSDELATKSEIVCLNKCDSVDIDEANEKAKSLSKDISKEVVLCSGISGLGVNNLLMKAINILDHDKNEVLR